MHKLLLHTAVMVAALQIAYVASAAPLGVKVTPDEAHRRVDITIDGEPFTSYVWPTTLKKPTLFPLMAPGQIEVTRGYPLTPHPGERVDHPHHAGLWFNYGNVNGFDFWNNSEAIKPEDAAKMGTIQHQKIITTRSGINNGELAVQSVWITGTKQPLIEQTTSYVFSHMKDARVIDLTIKLHALERAVFKDDKEGLLGMRVARWLESSTEKSGIFTDASGRETKMADMDNSVATGIYLTSEGKRGDAVWSTRGSWCSLTGHTGDKTATVAIFDHEGNPGYPTYWHARGYGLFAANPLGQKIFDHSAPELNFTIEKGSTAVFHYRVILISHVVSVDRLNREAADFNTEK